MSKSLYRCVASRSSWFDFDMALAHSAVVGVEYKRYEVVKETEKGFWVTRNSGWPASWVKKLGHKECRFVLKGKGKRFASETKEQALHNFWHRAYSRRNILEQQTKDNEVAIMIIEAELKLQERTA